MTKNLAGSTRSTLCYNIGYNGTKPMKPLKIIAIGNSSGVILPKEMLDECHLAQGDHLHLVKTADGWLLAPYDPVLARQLDLAEQVMREDRDVLRVLAK